MSVPYYIIDAQEQADRRRLERDATEYQLERHLEHCEECRNLRDAMSLSQTECAIGRHRYLRYEAAHRALRGGV